MTEQTEGTRNELALTPATAKAALWISAKFLLFLHLPLSFPTAVTCRPKYAAAWIEHIAPASWVLWGVTLLLALILSDLLLTGMRSGRAVLDVSQFTTDDGSLTPGVRLFISACVLVFVVFGAAFLLQELVKAFGALLGPVYYFLILQTLFLGLVAARGGFQTFAEKAAFEIPDPTPSPEIPGEPPRINDSAERDALKQDVRFCFIEHAHLVEPRITRDLVEQHIRDFMGDDKPIAQVRTAAQNMKDAILRIARAQQPAAPAPTGKADQIERLKNEIAQLDQLIAADERMIREAEAKKQNPHLLRRQASTRKQRREALAADLAALEK